MNTRFWNVPRKKITAMAAANTKSHASVGAWVSSRVQCCPPVLKERYVGLRIIVL